MSYKKINQDIHTHTHTHTRLQSPSLAKIIVTPGIVVLLVHFSGSETLSYGEKTESLTSFFYQV